MINRNILPVLSPLALHASEESPEGVQLPGLLLQIPEQKIKALCMDWIEFYFRDLGWADWSSKDPK